MTRESAHVHRSLKTDQLQANSRCFADSELYSLTLLFSAVCISSRRLNSACCTISRINLTHRRRAMMLHPRIDSMTINGAPLVAASAVDINWLHLRTSSRLSLTPGVPFLRPRCAINAVPPILPAGLVSLRGYPFCVPGFLSKKNSIVYRFYLPTGQRHVCMCVFSIPYRSIDFWKKPLFNVDVWAYD